MADVTIELAVGAVLLLMGMLVATSTLLPDRLHARVLSGAGGLLSRGVRGIVVDPATPWPGTQSTSQGPERRIDGPPPRRTTADPEFTLTVRETLQALEEVLSLLPALLNSSGYADIRIGRTGPPAELGVTVSGLIAESLPPLSTTAPDPSSNPILSHLFKLCEEELRADASLTRPAAPVPNDPPGGTTMSDNTDQESPISGDAQASSADAATEMFDVAMTALAQALVDPDDAVREASVRALRGIGRETVRSWVSAKLRSGAPDDVDVAWRIASTAELREVAAEVLDQALGGPEPDHSLASAVLRALAPSPEQVGPLIGALGEPQRVAVVALLSEFFEDHTLTSMLEALVGDDAESVRLAALEALGRQDDIDATLHIASRAIATDESVAVRLAAAHLLGQVGTAALRPLGSQPSGARATDLGSTASAVSKNESGPLDVDDPTRLWEVVVSTKGRADVLGEAATRNPGTLLAAAEAHADDADPEARALAVRAGLHTDDERGIALVVRALSDPDPRVRREAVEGWRRTEAANYPADLIRLVADPDHDVRAAAVEALGRSDSDEVLASLVRALADPAEDIRTAASAALCDHASPQLARVVVDLLEEERGRRAAAALLVAMGGVGQRAVEEAFSSLSSDAVLAAAPIFGAGTDGHRYIADLTSLDAQVRLRAVSVLGAIGTQDAAVALLGRLQDPVDDIRIEALDHLGRLGGAGTLPPLKQIVSSDPAPAVVAAAKRALDEIAIRIDAS